MIVSLHIYLPYDPVIVRPFEAMPYGREVLPGITLRWREILEY